MQVTWKQTAAKQTHQSDQTKQTKKPENQRKIKQT
jgi:hypothetical protein